MEVDLRMGTDGGSIKSSVIVSKSGHSQAVMVPGEVVLSNNQEQEAYKCEHFSIRGYVAEVRKREMKLCWPLFKIHNCRSDVQPNLAPQLSVKNFRRWNCQNCLQEISDPETAIENGIAMNIQNDLVQSDYPSSTGTNTVESQPPTIKTIASLPHQSEERLVERESFIPRSTGDCLPLICRGQQVNDLQSSDFTKEGISVPRGGQDKCHKYKKCMSPTIIAEGEAFQGGNITVRSIRSEDDILGKQKFDIVLPSKWKDTELVHGVTDTEMSNKVIASTSFNVPLPDQKDDHGINETMKIKDLCRKVGKDFWMPRKDKAIQPSHHDRDSHEETDMDLVHTQDDVMNPAGSVDRPQNKRAPKLRSLYDILIRSDEIRKAEKVGISSGGAGTDGNTNDEKMSIARGNSGVNGNYNGKPEKSKSEDETPDCRSDLVTQKAESKPNRKRTIPSDGEGPCLVRWLKKVPRKAKSNKGDAQGKRIDTEVGKCRSVVVRDLDLNREYCGEEDEQEIIGEKSNLMSDVEIMQPPCMPKEDELPLKGHMIAQHQPACASLSTNSHSKMSVAAKSKDMHQGRKTQERGNNKVLLSNKKNKRPRTEEDGIPSRTQWLKRNGFQLHEKGTEKQITTWTSEQQDEDDIPMDIVELLAKHQHERSLMNGMTDNGSTRNLSVMTEGIKDDNRCSMANYRSNHNLRMMFTKDVNMWGTGGAHGKKVSDETHWRISPEESQSNFKEYNHLMAIRNDRKVVCEPESYHSYRMCKQNHHIDLNQEAPISASVGFPAFSPSIGLSVSADQPPNRNFYPQNISQDRMEMLTLCSDQMNHTTRHNSSSFHDGSSILVNGTPAFRSFDLNFNCNDLYPRETPEAVAHNAGYQMMLDLSGKHLLLYKDESSISEGRTSATKPCPLSVNGHNSKMMDPVELDTNESISALNLLRLMDQAACSGEPRCSSIHSIRSTQLGQGNELLRSEVGIRSSEAAKVPIIVDKADQDQQPRNSGIPIRPVARVGVLGPLLQKEIATSSSNSKPSFGFQASSEQSSLKTSAMGKGEAFHSAAVTKTMNEPNVSAKEVGYSIGPLENIGCSVAGNSIVQHATNNKNDTLQPVISTCKMEVCLLNRNPADFAMPDEDSEYMIGYKENKRRYTPRSKNLQSPSHLKGKKRQRVMKVNNLKG